METVDTVIAGELERIEPIFGPFNRGEFRELTDQDWQDLMDGKRKSLHDPQSLALPPKG